MSGYLLLSKIASAGRGMRSERGDMMTEGMGSMLGFWVACDLRVGPKVSLLGFVYEIDVLPEVSLLRGDI